MCVSRHKHKPYSEYFVANTKLSTVTSLRLLGFQISRYHATSSSPILSFANLSCSIWSFISSAIDHFVLLPNGPSPVSLQSFRPLTTWSSCHIVLLSFGPLATLSSPISSFAISSSDHFCLWHFVHDHCIIKEKPFTISLGMSRCRWHPFCTIN